LAIKLFWKHRALFLPDLKLFWPGLLVLAIANGLALQIIILIQQIIDGFKAGSAAALEVRLGWIVLMSVGVLGFRIASRQFLLGIGRYVEFRLRNALFEKLLSLPPAYYSAHPTGELMSRMINDVRALRYLFGGGILLGFNTVFAYGMTLPVMWGYSWRLTIMAFTVLPVAIFLMSRVSRTVKQAYLKVQEVLGEVSTVAQENFAGMGVIQAFVCESVEDQRFQQSARRYFDASVLLIRRRVWLFLIMALVTSLGILIVLAEGGRAFMAQELTWGAFAAFVLMLERLSWPTGAMGWVVTMWQQGHASMKRIDEVLSTPNILESPDADSQRLEQINLDEPITLDIRHLSFAYQNPYQDTPATEPSSEVLQDITVTARGGETIAIVGQVGSGKSTLLQLIPKLYPVSDGQLLINGQDVNHYPLDQLRAMVTLMPQHSLLFSASVADNIAFPNPTADCDLIIESAQVASVHDDIVSFANQYQTLVGERGITLSGGQRQRTALARTLMVTPAILLLDDPFSNVDSQTEQQIIAALADRQVFKNKLTLIATHRLSVIQQATRVWVMAHGRIVADGTHDTLMVSTPEYRRLHELAQLRETLQQTWGHVADDQVTLPSAGDEVPA